MSYNSLVTYVLEGDGRTSFPLPFPVDFTTATIEVWLDGAIYSEAWTYDDINAAVVFSVPPVGTELMIRRRTNVDSKRVTFNARSMLNETELNRSVDQLFYAAQEAGDMISYTVSANIDSLVGAIAVHVASASEQAEIATTQANRAEAEADRAEFAGDNTIIDVIWKSPSSAVFGVEATSYPLGGSIVYLSLKPPTSPVSGTRYTLTYIDGAFEWQAIT